MIYQYMMIFPFCVFTSLHQDETSLEGFRGLMYLTPAIDVSPSELIYHLCDLLMMFTYYCF